VRRPARVRGPLPPNDPVQGRLQAAHPRLHTTVAARLHEPRSVVPKAVVPKATWWRARRGRREVAGGSSWNRPPGSARHPDGTEQHREQQDREREHAGTLWEGGGWMFAQPNGRPIDPTMDRAEWKRLLSDAGVRDARLQTPATPRPRCSCFWACPSGPSWSSWAGRTAR
jgi:hypothetical protein